MPWSGGIFSRVRNWVTDANASINIEPDLHDSEDDNLRDGINNCIAKDGTNSPTADLNFGGFRLGNIGAPNSADDALNQTAGDARYYQLSLALSPAPQGRLTLSTGVPVMTSTVSGATTVYYTPYVGRLVPIYDGAAIAANDIGGELSQTTTDSTKSPAAVAADKNYDIFVWNDSGTYRATRGPAWTSDTARGTGAGTTELEYVRGVLVNKIAITNGPAAQRGTYVGTIRSNGSSQIDWIYGGLSAGGTEARFGVWNAYNRQLVATLVSDSTDSWTYGSATWRAANNSSTMRVSFVTGINVDAHSARYAVISTGSATGYALTGIGVDSTTAPSGVTGYEEGGTITTTMPVAEYAAYPGIGRHYLSALEKSQAGTATFTGDGGGDFTTGLTYQGWF